MNRWMAALFLLLVPCTVHARSMAVTSTLTRAESESSSHILPPPSDKTGSVPAAQIPALDRPPVVARVAKASKSQDIVYNVIKIANFDSKQERNDYDGGYFGVWNKDPDDPSQGCKMTFFEPGPNESGVCLKLDYDVDSFHPAYNGMWLLFIDLDLTGYSNVCFWVRADKVAGCTSRFGLELKNEDEDGRTIVSGITTEWQLITVPLSDFGGVSDWTKMTEFVIVFEDRLMTKKTGTLYIDDIYFETARPKGTVDMADPRMSREEAAHAQAPKDESSPARRALDTPQD